MNKKKKNNDYLVLFKGAKLSKREANKVGVGIIFGIIGIFVSIFITPMKNKIVDYAIIFIFIILGYYWVGNKLFKK